MQPLTNIALIVTAVASFAKHVQATSTANGTMGNTMSVQWGSCEPFGYPNTTLSCGLFEVPLDYHDRSAGHGRISVIKANATGDRQGTFFFNPGGPGGSGLASLVEGDFYATLLDFTGGNYDVVSWDPRGVGTFSIPGEVYCFGSLEEYNTFFNGTIEPKGIEMYGNFTDESDLRNLYAQADTMEQKYTEVGKMCAEHSEGKHLQYLATAATVRDMVALADALEGPGKPINYYGVSYGTFLGAWFVNMFPEARLSTRVGKVILDGVLDAIAFSKEELAIGWNKPVLHDADRLYEAFITGCALAGPQGCAITTEGQTPLELHASFQAILKTAHDAAVRDPTVPITSGTLRRDLLYPNMYSPSLWMAISNETMPAIFEEVAQEAQGLANATNARRADKELRSLFKRAENETQSYTTNAVLCADSVDSTGTLNMTDLFTHVVETSRDVSHMFGAIWPFQPYYCNYWPTRSVERYTGPFNKTLANPILVFGNTYDPITPYSGAKALADALGKSAGLVRMNGFGHSTLSSPSACVQGIVDAYIANGTVPQGEDTVCEVDDSFKIWPGITTRMILGT
ncbi:TAP-like protein-domain-containing protein [Daedaleopsis nitida]|nr:TAP-like protein-domain-containing protein [Daedaleopsis nitida]